MLDLVGSIPNIFHEPVVTVLPPFHNVSSALAFDILQFVLRPLLY